jgi:nitrogen-specific signal transduction histidine kinase
MIALPGGAKINAGTAGRNAREAMPTEATAIPTYFAPAGRDDPPELRRKVELIRAQPVVRAIIDALPGMVLILNTRRQVILANRALLDKLRVEADDVVGKRPGELIGCWNWREGPDGCGTAANCITCGAVTAVLEGQNEPAMRECRLLLDEPVAAALDLRVTAVPVQIGGESFVVCSVEDIGPQKRLAVLTRMFFHDVLNVVGGIKGYLYGLARRLSAGDGEKKDLAQLTQLADRLVDEIEAHRDLTRAESGELEVQPQTARASTLVADVVRTYAAHPAAEGRSVYSDDVWSGHLVTDVQLFARVLGNMLLNALEATPTGGRVKIACREQGDRLLFSVHNPGVMPDVVQMQIFHRSFSTKGQSGRGLGTHSMKLFAERYLQGQIRFTSRAADGTVFTLSLPKVLSSIAQPAEGDLR